MAQGSKERRPKHRRSAKKRGHQPHEKRKLEKSRRTESVY